MSNNDVFSLATITAYVSSKGCQIKMDGETSGTTKWYRRLSSTVYSVGDRVLVAKIAGSYVVIGMLRP